MKPHYFVLCAALLLAPLGLRLGAVPLLHQVEQLGWINISEDHTIYKVEAIEQGVLLLQAPDHSHKQMRLAGLTISNRWRGQADGVLLMVLNATGARIRLTDEYGVIALPNGTLLQEVLLADGLAKLDTQSFPSFSQSIRDRLLKAEVAARAQHKNIWGDSQTTLTH